MEPGQRKNKFEEAINAAVDIAALLVDGKGFSQAYAFSTYSLLLAIQAEVGHGPKPHPLPLLIVEPEEVPE